MHPFYSDDTVTLYHGDVLHVLRELDVTVDVVVADPPYCSGGRTSSERTKKTSVKYRSSDARSPLPEFSGDSRDQRSYVYWSSLWLALALKLTRQGGLAFVWTDWRQLPATTDALQAAGWTWRGVVTWDKAGGRPVRGRFRLDSEFVVWGSKGDLPAHADAYPSSIVRASAPRARVHIAQKPVDVFEHLFSIAPKDGVVLDPFVGSGSALVAAKESGRKAVGIELDEISCANTAARLATKPMAVQP